ncbi:MAG: agmatinase [Firmicutes bacterium]|nr:agmatinase [Bacillota bacterium]HXL04442.1 agmatinase [Bacillota bacterium]
MNDLLKRREGFYGAWSSYDEADIIIVGLPMDITTSWRKGAGKGPFGIRNVSHSLEDYSPVLNKSLSSVKAADIGDVSLPLGNVEGSLEAIQQVIGEIVRDGKIPFSLGGEHLVTLACIAPVAEAYENMVILHLDAHADSRHKYAGRELSHATVMRRVSEIIGVDNLYQIGIRSGTAEEFATGLTRITGSVPEAAERALNLIDDLPCYITLDIDVVDPAFAPGTGTPEPGGCSSPEILEAVRLLGKANIIGFDLVEVSPPWDTSDITSLLAAKIIREMLLQVSAGLTSK